MASRIFYHGTETVAMDIVMPLIFVVATLAGYGIIAIYSRKSQKKGQSIQAVSDDFISKPIYCWETLGLMPDETLPADIVKLARSGQMGEAANRYRKLNGSSLQEACDAIGKLEDLAIVEGKLDRVLRELAVTSAIKQTASVEKDAPAALDELEGLVRQGKIIEAVNQYRKTHGGTLQRARQQVEAVELYLEQR